MGILYEISEVFNTRLEAVTFYHSIYEYTIKFKVINLDIILVQDYEQYRVFGKVSIMGDLNGVTESNIINHIKNYI